MNSWIESSCPKTNDPFMNVVHVPNFILGLGFDKRVEVL